MSRNLYNLKRLFVVSLLVPMVFSALLTTTGFIYLIKDLLIGQAQERVAANLRSASEIYNSRLSNLEEFAGFIANLDDVRTALASGDLTALRLRLQSLRRGRDEDILTATNKFGKVLVRARATTAGDDVSHLAPVEKALAGDTVAASTVLDGKDIAQEGADLLHQARMQVYQTPYSSAQPIGELTDALVMMAAAPVRDDEGNVIGAIYTGDLINRDYKLVDKVLDTALSSADEGATATIFLGPVRVSTNVPSQTARRAVGTRVSDEVRDRVLTRGEQWIGRAFVVNDWYLTAYRPIHDLFGDVIGMLYVGTREEPYNRLLYKAVSAVIFFHLLGGALAVFIVMRKSSWLTEHLGVMAEGAKRVADGDLDFTLPVEWDDELGLFTSEFNKMTAALKEREGAIAALNEGLDQKVAERSRQLSEKNEELLAARSELLEMMERQKLTNSELSKSLDRLKDTQSELIRSGKLAALGAMAAGVAHEINTPLTVIDANIEILKMLAADKPEIMEEVELITSQTARMQKIVGNLLTFARREQVGNEKLLLNELVDEVAALLETQAAANHVKVVKQLSGDTCAVEADRDQMAQVLTNLAVNAIQAMPTGGTLTITTGTTGGGGEVFLRVADTGKGVGQTDKENVFNPFYTTKGTGTGLGLSIAHAIVENHNGKLHLEDAEGGGAVLTVVLPRASG